MYRALDIVPYAPYWRPGDGRTTRERLLVCAFIAASFLAAVIAGSVPVASAADDIDVVFDFSPSSATYMPGANFTVTFTVRNGLANISGSPNEVKVTNISAYFSWMGPSEQQRLDLSNTSSWLYPDEVGVYSMNLSIPANAQEKVYSYVLKVEYLWLSAWGAMEQTPWSSPTYHDFEVSSSAGEEPTDGGIDLMLVLAGLALVLAVGAIGAFLYHSRGPGPVGGAEAESEAVEAASTSGYPIIHAAPGERFPVERGFIYLVKEKRPSIGFMMFNEAVAHGARGMLVAREHPNRLKQTHDFDAAKILWLTRRVGVDHIDPTELSLLSLDITRFVEAQKKSVVLLEGLEYVITQNDFETVLRFVNHLHDFVLAHDCAVIIIIDPRVLSTRELALLERSARIVEPAEAVPQKPSRPSESAEA